ncbi:MAG: transporter [Dorea longicatena]|nr:transporter [Dorea longicatena]
MSRHPALTIPILILFFSMLSFPQTVFTGASYGLVLWFRHVLPTLLPYMILINVLICTPALHWICRITSTFLCPLLGTSYYGTFAVLTGFLCGYPMGAKTASDLLDTQKISRSEASYLLSFCNNTSPAFILSYVVAQNMKERNLCIPFFLILTFTPLMLSFIFRLFYRLPESSCSFPQVTPGSFSNPSESISDSFLDRCILNAFESVTKVGGYMMMFSVLIQLLASVLPNTIFSLLLYSSLEISTGIRLLFSSALYTTEKIILCAFLTSFGGWCCIAQTYSMISSSQLPILPYITAKLVTALVTSLLISAYIYAI